MKDIAGYTHDALIELGAKWLKNQHNNWPEFTQGGCGIILKEFKSGGIAIPDVIGFTADCSVVIECKVSRSDFLADHKKSHRQYTKQYGNLRYFFTLPHVAKPEDVPEGWGLLYPYDKSAKVIKWPTFQSAPEIKVAEYSILYSLGLRISNHGLLKIAMQPYGIQKDKPRKHAYEDESGTLLTTRYIG